MKEEIDEIMVGLGDLLLQLGCDTGWLIPNTSLNTKQLNASIAKYQFLLDSMELEITSASAKARERLVQPPPAPVEVKEDVPEEGAQGIHETEANNDNANIDVLDNPDTKFTDDFGGGLGDEMDFNDMGRTDHLGMFNEVNGLSGSGIDAGKLDDDDGYGLLDDQYF